MQTKKRLFVDMDGSLCEFRAESSLASLYQKGYFAQLRPHDNVLAAVKMLAARSDVEVFVLSAYLEDSKYALAEKNGWLDLHLPEIKQSHRLFPPCGSKKSDIVPGGVQESDILIDDFSVNLHEWVAAGGRGLKLRNGINGKHGTWKNAEIGISDSPAEISEKVLAM